MLHLLPVDEADQHDTHPQRRCPCGGRLELVITAGLIGWQYAHQALDQGPPMSTMPGQVPGTTT